MKSIPRAGVGLTLCSLALLHARAEAVEYVTNSGTLLRQNPVLTGPGARSGTSSPTIDPAPAPLPEAAPGELAFVVNDVQLTGDATDAERARIADVVAPIRGHRITFARLQALRGEINLALFRFADAPVSVRLPPQSITDGVVRLEVLHGRIEDVRVENASNVSNRVLEDLFARRRTLRQIRRGVRLAQRLPGVGAVQALMSEGRENGGTLVTVQVAPGDTLAGGVVVDNAGSTGAGKVRVGLAGSFENPFGQGDRLDALAYLTPGGLQSGDGVGETRLGRIGYETSFAQGRARVGAAYSQVGYRLGGAFEGLGKGDARVGSLYAVAPALHAGGSDLDVGATIERRRLDDRRFGDLLESRRESDALALTLNGDVSGALQAHRMAVRYTGEVRKGQIRREEIDRTTQDVLAQDGKRDFLVVRLSADVLKAVTPNVVLSARGRGQWSGEALDASERAALGGPDAVRAYDQNAAAVDSGGVVSLGASYHLPRARGTTIDLFYDYGRGTVRALGDSASERASLHGAGVGLAWQRNGFAAQISYARPTGASTATAHGQTWFTVRKSF
ncbi:ShlB/FhaC/HecB family hemolysin secretion/activation protein [Lysobacter arvi]|uniref:ShlB/FhaC/HecB family hemolysin secretion/activation protein n=1 Tax=Lysobacter arvi TaxID=3038776 RepID=A0ABU1CF75_9GAMM|nr:ShlB/FhaC/HecB family hemolysin secretion/activation protein [Lysobacter arvi]MDR0183600.1 ShlB/FhaC/HecB family hemolysin secretion/activation protein [Lysobacter arvi]